MNCSRRNPHPYMEHAHETSCPKFVHYVAKNPYTKHPFYKSEYEKTTQFDNRRSDPDGRLNSGNR